MAMKAIRTIVLRIRRRALELPGNNSGLAAVEFAMIIPLMAAMLVGTNEFAAGVAIDRKVTLMARTLSDLTSQNIAVTNTQLTNFFSASKAVMTPYPSAPVRSTITELYVDPATKQARVQWSKGAAPRATGTTVTIPDALKVGDTYLIFSEVDYTYTPTVGYVLKSSLPLHDTSYTRPRQVTCIMYGGAPSSCTP